MNSGGKGDVARVTIPSGVKKIIANIKEITNNNHSEDDIYAVLKECAMDPNETAQKLLLLDTFHEVKRKRNRRKEDQNKEPEDKKWKPGTQARSNRVGRVNYITRNTSQDAGGGSSSGLKENASNYPPEKANSKVLPAGSREMKTNDISPNESQTIYLSNSSSEIESQHEKPAFSGGDFDQSEKYSSIIKLDEPLPPSSKAMYSKNSNSIDANNPTENEVLQSENIGESLLSSTPESYLSSSNFQDLSISDVASDSQSEQGVKHADFQLLDDNISGSQPSNNAISSEIAISKLPNAMPNYLLGVDETQHSTKHSDPSQVISQQKEWKPKSSHSNSALSVATTGLSEGSKEATLELETKLKDANFAEKKHVVKKLGFCFGSFDASFELNMNQSVVGVNDRNPTILFESSDPKDEPVNDTKFRSESTMLATEDAGREYSEPPVKLPASAALEQTELKLEAAQEIHQHTLVNTPSSYNLGLIPPTISNQVAPLESLESQARDALRLPGFIMPQSFDPANYYSQFYRPGFTDTDGRISPFHPAGALNKYNGNNTLVSSQTSQTHQEFQGNGQLVTQAAGVMRSSVSPTQQPLTIFRHPSGVHLPHYTPNFIPYTPYFSPFYPPPPPIHQFLNNGTFPQQPQTGSLYPSAPGTSSKHSVAQFKHESNTGNSTPANYVPYDPSIASYTSSSSLTFTSSSSDDVQQNEGSGVWFYNLPQGQMPFNPPQPGPGAANTYQQQNHTHSNWPSNY